MHKYLLFAALFCATPIIAQEPLKSDLAPCGVRGVSDWLREYRLKTPVSDRSEDTLWVALQAHLLAKDNGSGRTSTDNFLNSFCQLNEDFAASNIQFYFKNEWDLLNESDWHTHTEITEGIEMMLTNNVPDALNTYFVSDPAGNCGYNLPYAGVAIAHSCSGANDHTWSHEVGHALSLPHPFIGWEGKIYNFNTPTPVRQTYDYTHFHDTLETQVPAPLDTALVELVDGSNCAQAADLICDTKPDYLSYRWDCDAQNNSLVKQKDPLGAEFYSDGTLYMSYAFDHCQNRFSPEEIAVMRATLLSEKANWILPSVEQQPITDLTVAIEPVQEQSVPSLGAILRWNATPNATKYLVQASRFTSFSYIQVNEVTTDTFVVAGQLTPNLKYYWRVRPFNDRSACMPFNPVETFRTGPLLATTEQDADGWRYYPTLIEPGTPLNLEIPETWRNQEARFNLFDAAGRLVWQSKLGPMEARMTVELPSNAWPAGMYHFTIQSEIGVKRGVLISL